VAVELNGHGLPSVVTIGDDQRGYHVESIGEVWRVDDEWWRRSITRRCVEVILEGGKHMLLFEDLASGEWFVQNF
jgi:hypothetical protein